MPVSYNGKKIIPGPFATINKEVDRNENGASRRISYSITLKGNIVADKGSPNSTGVFWDQSGYPPDESIGSDSRLGSIIRKQGALAELFCIPNKLLEIQSYDGSPPFKAIARLRSINFEEGKWYDLCPFTITLEAETVFFGNQESCSGGTADTTPPEESWSLEQGDDRGRNFRLTHTVSSTAKTKYDINGDVVAAGWKIARDICLSATPGPFLGIDTEMYSSPNARILTDVQAYNYTRGQSIDESSGKYSVSESWLLHDPSTTGGVPCLEEYTVNVRTSDVGQTRVSIEGTLTGLEVRDNTTFELISDRWTNAQARWEALRLQLPTIADANAGITLNPVLLGSSIGKNPNQGTISFSREYDDRPIVFAGAINASIQVSEKNPLDIFASIVVLGKASGPVLQNIGTVTARDKRLAIEITMPAPTMTIAASSLPNTDAIVTAYTPIGATAFKTQDDVSWSEQSGRYSRNVAWTYVL